MPSFVKLISFCDFISQEPSLMIFGKARYQNIYGGILSVLSVFVIFVVSSYLTSEVINRKSVQIIYNEENNDHPSVNLTGLPIFFYMVDNVNGSAIPQKGVYDYIAMRFEVREASVNGRRNLQTNIFPINMVNCSETDFGKWNYLKTNITGLKDNVCFPPDEKIEMEGVYAAPYNQTFVSIRIFKCKNTTENNNGCYPEDYINEKLSMASAIAYNYPDYNIDNKNSTQAGQFKLSADLLPVALSFSRIYQHQYINVEYTTDKGFVFEDLQTENFYIRDNLKSEFQLATDELPILEFAMVTASAKKDVYTRTYLKFQNLLANIGGVAKSVLIISQGLSLYLTDCLYYLALGNNLSLFNPAEEEKANKTPIQNFTKFNVTNPSAPLQINQCNIFNKNKLPADYIKEKEVNKNVKFGAKLSITFNELLYKKVCFKTRGNYKYMDKMKEYLDTKLSVDEICKKLYELDKIKFALMNSDLINLIHFIPGPKINLNKNKQLLNRIEELWKKHEFSTNHNNHSNLAQNLFESEDINIRRVLQLIKVNNL